MCSTNTPLYNLNRTAATYADEMSKALKSIGMDQPSWRILMLLDDREPSSVGELSRRSVTKMSTITRILTRMENEGLVRRQAHSGDNRVVEVYLTEAGRAILGELKEVASRVFAAAFVGISEREVAAFVSALKTVRENLARPRFTDD